jgi:hypothetical protein
LWGHPYCVISLSRFMSRGRFVHSGKNTNATIFADASTRIENVALSLTFPSIVSYVALAFAQCTE